MRTLGAARSCIRELYEYGRKRKAAIGEENVFDFSLGNPSMPPPNEVTEVLGRLLAECDPLSLHGYTSASGDPAVKKALSDSLNRRFAIGATPDCLYLTAGAAAALTVSLNALVKDGEEVLLFAPYFPEYKVFVEHAGGRITVAPTDADGQPDLAAAAALITPRTRAVLINSPNNPTGAVIEEESLRSLAALLKDRSESYGAPIYLLSDEPYRELVYDGVTVPFPPHYYDNTLVLYSFSKSLSLPGDRIGYILVSPRAEDFEAITQAVAGAGRALGYVCAPALFQKMLPSVLELLPDVEAYRENRDLLVRSLGEMGYRFTVPRGAFYLYLTSPIPDARAFSEAAKREELLLVPSDDFGEPGHLRLSYCVERAMIERSLPAFRRLAVSYGLCDPNHN